LVVLHNCFYC